MELSGKPRAAILPPRTRPRNLVVLCTLALVFYFCYRHQTSSRAARIDDGPLFIPSSIDWSAIPDYHPPPRIKGLPPTSNTGRQPLPAVQAPTSAFRDPSAPDPRRDSVLRVFQRSWDAYRKHAWLHDELSPVSGGAKDPFGGWAATLVDTLDTLWIMNLTAEFDEAAAAVGRNLDFAATPSGDSVNVFETTIRHLGGLLSAYDLSGNEVLLTKAVELGELLYKAFDTPNRMPVFWLDFQRVIEGSQHASTNGASAAAASLCLELTRLSQLAGKAKFHDAADQVTRFLAEAQTTGTKLPGLWPQTLNLWRQDAASTKPVFTMGASADSLYEYLPKMHALTGGVDPVYEDMYRGATAAAERHLLFRPMLPPDDEQGSRRSKFGDLLFLGDAVVHSGEGPVLVPDSQHLTCFAGGMFALGGRLFGITEHVDIGEQLARGCAWAYSQFPAGVMPEIFGLVPCRSQSSSVPGTSGCPWDEQRWRDESEDASLGEGWRHVRDPQYLLRPEAIESIFVLYRITGKEDLRDLAWDMFQGIEAATETSLAYAAITSVRDGSGRTKKLDSMEVSLSSSTHTEYGSSSRVLCLLV